MIAVAAGRHEGLRAEICRFAQAAPDEGNGAARVERMTLDTVLAQLARLGQGPVDPLQALFVPSEPRLRDAEQQCQGRGALELGLIARAQELDHRGVMTGGSQRTGFREDRRRLYEALVA
jgi:hypothetical protein